MDSHTSRAVPPLDPISVSLGGGGQGALEAQLGNELGQARFLCRPCLAAEDELLLQLAALLFVFAQLGKKLAAQRGDAGI